MSLHSQLDVVDAITSSISASSGSSHEGLPRRGIDLPSHQDYPVTLRAGSRRRLLMHGPLVVIAWFYIHPVQLGVFCRRAILSPASTG